MAYWLMKTEPEEFSIDDLERKGRDHWDGVKNPVALRNMRNMKPGDDVFIYHTGKERRVVGLAKVAGEPYQAPNQGNPKVVWVDVEFRSKVKTPVTLAEMKADAAFEGFVLLRQPRLSVMPVPDDVSKKILERAGA